MEKTKARDKYLSFLHKMYQSGNLKAVDKIDLLRREGYIGKAREIVEPIIDNIKSSGVESHKDWEIFMHPFLGNEGRYKKMNPVSKEDWMPDSVLEHTPEFISWIDSFLYSPFPNKIFYKPFDLYKAQAWQWLQDSDNITHYQNSEARREFVYREYGRCIDNTFYFAVKYGELKEGDIASGQVSFMAREHQAVILYLFDCGYSIVGGKGRQIGFTSTLGIAANKKLVFQPNYYIKFITEDTETGEEIFTDKIKYPYSQLPRWMQPRVRSDAGRRFWLSNRRKKGQQGYPNSRVDVIAPRKTAINGGSPQLVLIDEIANIGILTHMLNEGRPTMFWNNPETGVFELKRQVIMWSSGVLEDKGHGAYEREWYRILGLWESKKYKECGFVPIFFSWHCRLCKEDYLKQKQWYYGARAVEKDIDLETSKTQFHIHYPTTYKDMFLTTANTLVSREIIEDGIERCRNLSVHLQPVLGYFEPIYNKSDPMPPESDTPYRIIGADFVPVDDEDWKKATTIMFQKPEKGWKWRYWQGTDPIATETGFSKQSSAIWDDYFKTISCIVNFRKQHDHKKAFLQCLLMGVYYDTSKEKKKGVKDLTEANIGTNYIDYKQSKGFFGSLIFNSQLPLKVAGGAREVGVDNKGNRADAIIEYMTELIRTYHARIYIKLIFDQLVTFTQKITQGGKETWQAINKLTHYDDALYACTYAYIARMCFPHVSPVRETIVPNKFKIVWEITRDADGNLTRIPIKKPLRNVKAEEIPENILVETL